MIRPSVFSALSLLRTSTVLLSSLGTFTHAPEPLTNSIGMRLVPIAPGSFVMG